MSNSISASDRREFIQLLVELEGLSKAAAKRVASEARPADLPDALARLRRAKLEANGQQSMELSSPRIPAATTSKSAKKIPYTFLLPPDQLEALQHRAESDDSSVSHHIRQAIRLYLRSR